MMHDDGSSPHPHSPSWQISENRHAGRLCARRITAGADGDGMFLTWGLRPDGTRLRCFAIVLRNQSNDS